MICQISEKINTQNAEFWKISLVAYYEQLVKRIRARTVGYFIPSSECISKPDSYILYGSYPRETIKDIQLIESENGSWEYKEIEISGFRVQRIQDTKTGATHAVLGDLFVPYKQYSLRYVLYHLDQFFSRRVSQENYCLDAEIELHTFRFWIKWLQDHIVVLRELGLTENYKENIQTLGEWICEIVIESTRWQTRSLQKLNLGLFQEHRMPANTLYRNYVGDG